MYILGGKERGNNYICPIKKKKKVEVAILLKYINYNPFL